MNNHKRRYPAVMLWIVVLCVMGLAPLPKAQAASIDTLSVNYASLTVQLTGGGTYSFTGPVAPPAVATMGAYQDPIIGGTDWKIYSTSLYGKPAPTGTVDAALGTINVDFSSLRGQVTTTAYGMIDFALAPLTNPPTGGSYNGSTGAFSLNWSTSPFSISLPNAPLPITGTASVTLSGTVTPVPLPAAVWLLGSGLLGVAAVFRRKRLL